MCLGPCPDISVRSCDRVRCLCPFFTELWKVRLLSITAYLPTYTLYGLYIHTHNMHTYVFTYTMFMYIYMCVSYI